MKSVKIDRFKYGLRVECMGLIIYKGNRFHEKCSFENILEWAEFIHPHPAKKKPHKTHHQEQGWSSN